ncbi:MAG: hypothetical protein ACLUDF_07010, partial [Butyricicoccus sp.]
GRSKVVRKFLYRNFLPPEMKKVSAVLARFLGRAARYTPRLFCICKANAILHALLRELAEAA